MKKRDEIADELMNYKEAARRVRAGCASKLDNVVVSNYHAKQRQKMLLSYNPITREPKWYELPIAKSMWRNDAMAVEHI